MIFTSRTHQGHIHQVNEDRLLVRILSEELALLLAADGLGGHPAGDVAASLVRGHIEQQPTDSLADNLANLLVECGQVIARHGAAHPSIDGMGSTATLVLAGKNDIEWAHVGDCRLYHLQHNQLECKTRDQTLARQMFDHGEIGLDELPNHKFSHMLEQCLGEDDIEPDSGTCTWGPGDMLLLCTDGLYNMVNDEEIHAILAQFVQLDEMADTLLNMALNAGGKDNVSFILGSNRDNVSATVIR